MQQTLSAFEYVGLVWAASTVTMALTVYNGARRRLLECMKSCGYVGTDFQTRTDSTDLYGKRKSW